MNKQPIGIFDSGIGGLTVLKKLIQKFPNETFIYVGDNARAPWGNKDKSLLSIYNDQIMTFLLSQQCKYIVVGCNTSQSYFGDTFSKKYSIPSMGLIDSTGHQVNRISTTKEVAVLATEGTIRSRAYENAITRHDNVTIVHNIPCPKFVPLLESYEFTLVELQSTIQEYLRPLENTFTDTIIYGCSHYPIIHPLIKTIANKRIKHFVDPANCIIPELNTHLENLKLKNSDDQTGKVHFHITGKIEQFNSICQQLNIPITSIQNIKFD